MWNIYKRFGSIFSIRISYILDSIVCTMINISDCKGCLSLNRRQGISEEDEQISAVQTMIR